MLSPRRGTPGRRAARRRRTCRSAGTGWRRSASLKSPCARLPRRRRRCGRSARRPRGSGASRASSPVERVLGTRVSAPTRVAGVDGDARCRRSLPAVSSVTPPVDGRGPRVPDRRVVVVLLVDRLAGLLRRADVRAVDVGARGPRAAARRRSRRSAGRSIRSSDRPKSPPRPAYVRVDGDAVGHARLDAHADLVRPARCRAAPGWRRGSGPLTSVAACRRRATAPKLALALSVSEPSLRRGPASTRPSCARARRSSGSARRSRPRRRRCGRSAVTLSLRRRASIAVGEGVVRGRLAQPQRSSATSPAGVRSPCRRRRSGRSSPAIARKIARLVSWPTTRRRWIATGDEAAERCRRCRRRAAVSKLLPGGVDRRGARSTGAVHEYQTDASP